MGLVAKELGWRYGDLLRMEHRELQNWCRWIIRWKKDETEVRERTTNEAISRARGKVR